MIKYILCILITLTNFTTSSAQCNVKKNQRDDGTTIYYTRPDRIGYCDKFFLGLSMQTDGTNYYLCAVCIFQSNPQNLKDKLTLFFNNNKSSTLQYYKSEETTMQNMPAVLNIFKLDANALNNISNSTLKMVMGRLNSGLIQDVPIMFNANKLQLDYSCLKSNLY